MPYKAGKRLPAERASRVGHLDVLASGLVKNYRENFKDASADAASTHSTWLPMPIGGQALPLIFGVDGSFQIVESESPPHSAHAFVKTALLRIDQYALASIDKDTPHPLALRDILADSAL